MSIEGSCVRLDEGRWNPKNREVLELLKADNTSLVEKIQQLQDKSKRTEKELQQLKDKQAALAGSEIAKQALSMLDVDSEGFDFMDIKLLQAIVERFDGGPVGLDNLAAAIGEERDTIEDVLEPYLIQQGFLQRTPRGRIATQRTYEHLKRFLQIRKSISC